ncbi:MAG: DUF2007 domain-containing protein [Archangium sp.]|nr:DUF2007 domain-containing protein [Archangium sp.]
MDCESPIEAIGVRSMLEAQGIACVVTGDQQSYFASWTPAATIQPRVMVAPGDLERARAFLAGKAEHETTGAPLEGALCPVHEAQAIATCARCGTFLCVTCRTMGSPPVCDACIEAEAMPAREPAKSPKTFFAVLALLVLLTLLLRGLFS